MLEAIHDTHANSLERANQRSHADSLERANQRSDVESLCESNLGTVSGTIDGTDCETNT